MNFDSYNSIPIGGISSVAPANPTNPNPTTNSRGSIVTYGMGTRSGVVTHGLGVTSTSSTIPPTSQGRLYLVLQGVKRLLTNAGIIDSSRIIISLTPEPIDTPTEPILVITPGSLNYRRERYLGGERAISSTDGYFEVHAVTYSGVDVAYSDESRLLDSTLGSFALIHKTMDALQGEFVLGTLGQHLTDEPVFIVSQNRTVPYRNERRWVRTPIVFSYNFTPLLTGSV